MQKVEGSSPFSRLIEVPANEHLPSPPSPGYEVRADGDRQAFRILFAPEGKRRTNLLALDGFSKKTQKTPPAKLALAERRLRDCRNRGN